MHDQGQEMFFQRAAQFMSEEESRQLRMAGMGRRVGFGKAPALLIIDVQNYMVGPVNESDKTEYPSACQSARSALPVIERIADAFRAIDRPVIYTQNVARRDGMDMGVKRIKRGLLDIDGWYLEGTIGAEIASGLEPKPGDIVLRKIKPSAFHGTPLLGLLLFAGTDTVVVTGGSTSNCIRATVIDSFSHNFRTIVPSDAVFDRVSLSHEVSLMDIDRQLGDVTTSDAVLAELASIGTSMGKGA